MNQKKVPSFGAIELRDIAKALEGAMSHVELDHLLRDAGLTEAVTDRKVTKVVRISFALEGAQRTLQCGDPVLAFVKRVLAPGRFVGRGPEHESYLAAVNRLLAFKGWRLAPNGKYDRIDPASTIDEAEERAGRLRAELERRRVHPEVLRYCQREYLQQNYFHTVLEATKSVSDRIRVLTGSTKDAGQVAHAAFSVEKDGVPLLAFNDLKTETDISEQKGLLSLFVGMFGTFRNTTAHAPKIGWTLTEQDALDLLTLASFLHRRLDAARRTDKAPP